MKKIVYCYKPAVSVYLFLKWVETALMGVLYVDDALLLFLIQTPLYQYLKLTNIKQVDRYNLT